MKCFCSYQRPRAADALLALHGMQQHAHADSMRTQQLYIQHFQLGRLSFSNVSSTGCFVSVPSLRSQRRAQLLRQIGQGGRLPVAARTSIRAPAQPSSLEAFPLSGSEQLRRQVTVAAHLCSSRQPSRPCEQVRPRRHPSFTSSTSGAAGGVRRRKGKERQSAAKYVRFPFQTAR